MRELLLKLYTVNSLSINTHTHSVDEEDTANTSDSPPLTHPAPIKRPALRAPLPPPKPSAFFAIGEDQGMYEEIITQGGTYHSIDDGSDSDDDPTEGPERHYEDLNLDESALYDMNKRPPPLWNPSTNPPPLPTPNRPPNRPPRKWSKSLEKHQSNEIHPVSTPPAPPTKPSRRSPSDDPEIQTRPLPAIPITRPVSEGRVPLRIREALTNQKLGGSIHGRIKKPMPPPPKPSKPSKFQSSDNLLSHSHGSGKLRGMGMGINISNDPKFKGKLQERRQEIYGGTNERFLKSQSWHEDTSLVPYEEIEFTGDEDSLVPRLNPAVRLGLDENDEGYIDCELAEDSTPQEYLDFETANRLVNEDIPLSLPKEAKDHADKMRRQFLSKPPLPIPPRDQIRSQKKVSSPKDHPKPPSPLKKPDKTVRDQLAGTKAPPIKRSTSIGEIPSGRMSPGCPTTSPPPLPSREVLRTHATPSPPPPLHCRDNHTIQFDNEEESPPPVPRRHPQASDKLRATSPIPANTNNISFRTPSPDNILPLPPRTQSPANLSPSLLVRNSAPPLPSRTSNRDALPPPPPNRSISEPFPRHGHPVFPASKSAPMSPDNEENNHYSFAEEEERDQPIFEPVQFGKRSPSPQIVNGLSSRNNQPPFPSRGKPHNFRQQTGTPPLPLRKDTSPLPSNKPPKDRSKPCPPPVANKPSSQTAKKPPLAQKPKPGAGLPKPSPTRTMAPASNESLHQRPRMTPFKPALKPKPLPPPKPVPGTA